MVDSDDDYEPPPNSLDSPPAKNFCKRPPREAPKVTRKKRKVTQQKPPPQRQARIPTNLKVLKPMFFHGKKQLQGCDIDLTLSLKVVQAILTL